MKRFILFAGSNSYPPRGGWKDYKDSFDSLEEAEKTARIEMLQTRAEDILDWYHVVDQATFKMVAQYRRPLYSF